MPLTTTVQERRHAFQDAFVKRAGLAIVLAAASIIVVFGVAHPSARIFTAAGVSCGAALVSLGLIHRGSGFAASRVLAYGVALGPVIAIGWSAGDVFSQIAIMGMMFVTILVAFLLSYREAVALCVAYVLLSLAGYARGAIARPESAGEILSGGVGGVIILVITMATVVLFVRHADENFEILRARIQDIDGVMERARRIAKGDLSGGVAGDNDVSRVIASMLEGLRVLVGEIRETSSRLASATNEISAMSRQQEQGAVEQASAVAETRRTLEALLESSRQIAESLQAVTTNAEATLKNSESILERIASLTAQTRRVGEILEMIKDIANKSDLLALNAALEGARAGETGRRFSLVANQMQRLTENVVESVKSIKSLTSDIAEATNATAIAADRTTKLAGETTSVARRISIITQQQRSSTEQVTKAMDDIGEVTHQSAAGSAQTLQAVRELAGLAERLNRTIDAFQM